MPSINMIAPRRNEMKRLERGIHTLVFVLLAELFVVVALTAVMSARTVGIRSKTADIEAELAKLQPIVAKIEFYEKASDALQPKLDLLDNARDRTMRWCHMLQALSMTMPEDTWITRIATIPPQPGLESNITTLNVNGISTSQNLIGETMLRLNSYKGFKTVDLHFTQRGTVGKRQVLEFEIGAGLKMGETVKGATN